MNMQAYFIGVRLYILGPVDCSDIKKKLEDEFENSETIMDSTAALQRDHMNVYLRVRPLMDEERKKGEDQVSSIDL